MTQKYYWIGDQGPFIYDDAVPILDPDGIFSGSPPNQRPLIMTEVPTEDAESVRLEDITSIVSEILPNNKVRLVSVGQVAAVANTTLFTNVCEADYVTMINILIYMLCNRGMGDNLLTNSSFETSDPPDDWSCSGTGHSVSRSVVQVKSGTYSLALTNSAGNAAFASQQLSSPATYISYRVMFNIWLWADTADAVRIYIRDYDGVDSEYEYSSFHSGGSAFENLIVTKEIRAGVTNIYCTIQIMPVTPAVTIYADSAHACCVELVDADYLPDSDNFVTLNIDWNDSINEFRHETKLDINRTGAHSKESFPIAIAPNIDVDYSVSIPVAMTNDPMWAFIVVATEV